MKLKSIKPARPVPRNASEVEAYISTEHEASSPEKPVLVIRLSNGTERAIGTVEAGLAGYHILEATKIEIRKLRDAGYLLPYASPEVEAHGLINEHAKQATTSFMVFSTNPRRQWLSIPFELNRS